MKKRLKGYTGMPMSEIMCTRQARICLEIICDNKTDSSPTCTVSGYEKKIKVSLLNRSRETVLAYMTSHLTLRHYCRLKGDHK